jgi:hypothetical protein
MDTEEYRCAAFRFGADINIFARSDKGAAAWSTAAFFSLHSAD